ncbi:hypothetical protein M0802_002919 [Mischocyttarus mexicanus]|nr:hypothetical protein M0802_002919 [Mischocyttarus mexicanus]
MGERILTIERFYATFIDQKLERLYEPWEKIKTKVKGTEEHDHSVNNSPEQTHVTLRVAEATVRKERKERKERRRERKGKERNKE